MVHRMTSGCMKTFVKMVHRIWIMHLNKTLRCLTKEKRTRHGKVEAVHKRFQTMDLSYWLICKKNDFRIKVVPCLQEIVIYLYQNAGSLRLLTICVERSKTQKDLVGHNPEFQN